ncbi:MAG TPA: hypothetical protein VHI71_05780 [Actinomycetota bacterium]|nr:hypothetical protein [Actinomycetota bacterium]
MPDPDPNIERRPAVGTAFDVNRFARPSADGVAAGFQLTGWWDFPRGGFELSVDRGIQKVRIKPEAEDNGDVGIERHFTVQPGDAFRLTARLRVASKTGKFKGRVNLAARRHEGGKQVKEFNDSQEDVTDTAVERIAQGVMPTGSEFLSVRVKFHTSAPGESGEGEIHSMRLERLAALPTEPVGKRLSLFDFNINKMRHDWRGWIRFVQDQRLRAPDIVLLQDVENDAEREELQAALAEAFGGVWNGAGSDPQWQTAIVWRKRRFTRAQHRIWRGFGGQGCVDNSQDAPAVQVKLFDTLAQKSVSLVSLKTPPQVEDSCVWSNVQKVDNSFRDGWDADLCVMGTDANSPDRIETGDWAPWYRRTVRSERGRLSIAGVLGFCDPVVDVCGADKARLDEHVTLRGRGRVDFLLLRTAARTAPAVVRQMTLPLGNASGSKWSDHRSIHAEIAY